MIISSYQMCNNTLFNTCTAILFCITNWHFLNIRITRFFEINNFASKTQYTTILVSHSVYSELYCLFFAQHYLDETTSVGPTEYSSNMCPNIQKMEKWKQDMLWRIIVGVVVTHFYDVTQILSSLRLNWRHSGFCFW